MEPTEQDIPTLVASAANAREQCAGRLPVNLTWKFQAFVIGTLSMTWLERGVYLGLLWRQFDKGSLPTNTDELASIVDMRAADFASLWHAKLAEKFTEHDGRLYNKAMLQEWLAQTRYLLTNRARGRKGGQAQASAL